MKTFLIVLLILHLFLVVVELIIKFRLKVKNKVRGKRFFLLQLVPIAGPVIGTLVILYLHLESKEFANKEVK